MDKFNETAYKNAYAREKYTSCKLMLKPEELAEIEEYRQILGLSKNSFFIRCALYCAQNDVRIEELPEISPQK